jgi:agmatine deiminase
MTFNPAHSKPTLPAEWAPQQSVLLAWPHEGTDWRAFLPEATETYLHIAKEISEVETVCILCMDENHQTYLQKILNKAKVNTENLLLIVEPYNDTWTRDYGPITLQNAATRQRTMLDFQFNGWGNKYNATKDNGITERLFTHGLFGEASQTAYQKINLVLEGGGIESDGAGTLLSTPQCVFPRNPELAPDILEQTLKTQLGMQRILWLHSGHLENDDTDGHIDTLARFCTAESIAYVACTQKNDPLYDGFFRMQQELEAFRTLNGKPYNLFPLPLPTVFNRQNQRLPATYANFLIINEKVLVPIYGEKEDQEALTVLKQAFPKHQVVGVLCRSLVHQYGSLHCVTMQLPTSFS